MYYLNVTDGIHNGSATFTILAPLLTVAPDVGQVSGNTTANGTGFDPGSAVALTFGGVSITACKSSTSLVANPAGNFSCTFQVPALPAGGPNAVNATDEINTAGTTYYLNRPTVLLTPSGGSVGSKVTATGTGFAAGTALSITFGTTAITGCSTGSTASNPFGTLSCAFSVPILLAGTYLVNASDGVNSALPASFQIGPPFLTLSVTRGPAGTTTTATGSGFVPSTPVSLVFSSTPISACISGQLTASGSGGLSCAFSTPASVGGSQTVWANDSVNSAAATFTVVTSLVLSQSSGTYGDTVNASGTGFDGGATVLVTWNTSYSLCSAAAGTDGSFSCSFSVPTAPSGTHTITATEGANAPTAAFQVEPVILLSAVSRDVGQPLIAGGYGFAAIEATTVLWDYQTPECGGSSTNTNGAVACTFLIPATSGGLHNVSFVQGSVELNRTVTVTAAFSIDPTSGVVGITVGLIGTGFQASTLYLACLEVSLVSCPSDSFSFATAANGSIPADTNFTIPPAVPGTYDLVVSVGTMIADEASFVVTTAALSLTPTTGPVGTAVSLAGSGFAPNSLYTYCFQASATPCPSSTGTDFETTPSGDIPSGVPPVLASAGPAGIYYVDVSQTTSLIGSGEFILLTNVTANLTSAAVSAGVQAYGTGFPTLTAFALVWNSSVRLCAGSTNSTGGFTCAFAVPPAARGLHTVTATAGSGLASFRVSVLPTLSVNPASGVVGTLVEAIGTGFDANAAYSILWNASPTGCSGWANASGSLACSFPVPAAPAGRQNISVLEAAVTLTVGFIVVPSLTEAPSSGSVGSVEHIRGTGFDAGSAYDVLWNTSVVVCSGTTNATGGFPCAFKVPMAPEGPDTIEVREGSNVPTILFTVTPSLETSSNEGPVGGSEAALGTGFAADAAYSFWWNTSALLCKGRANSSGVFDCPFTVPAAPSGLYNLTALEGGSSLAVPFTVVPSLLLSEPTGTVGSEARVAGTGFDADAPFALAWNSTTPLCSGATSSSGNLSCSFQIPNTPGGTYALNLTERSHGLMISLTVSPSAWPTQFNGTVGATVTVSGDGFVAGEPLVVSMAPSGGTLCTGMASASGGFACTFAVPSVPPGQYTITVTQGLFSTSYTFFVLTPPAPASPSMPFPWWLVAVVLVAALFGGLVIYLQYRRRPSARPGADRPGEGPATGPGGSGGQTSPPLAAPGVGTGPGVSASLAASSSGDDSAARLYNLLVPIYREVLKSPPAPVVRGGPMAEAPAPKSDVDVLVERLGPIYEEALKGVPPPGAPGSETSRPPGSPEEVRARIARLVPAYRTILKREPPKKPD